MKTVKIFLSIAGAALTIFGFGQRLSPGHDDSKFYSAYLNPYLNPVEHKAYQYPFTSGDHFEEPMVYRTYFAASDDDLAVEPWMTAPFETSLYEEELQIEAWMTAPFESNYYEPEIPVEPWMTAPFESNYYEPEIPIEPWMTAPFESNYYEPEISIEPWMTTPWV